MANKIISKILDVVDKLVTLEVVTAVGDVVVNVDDEKNVTVEIGATKAKGLVTTIDLVQGDIKNLMAPEFVNGDLTSLRAFHSQQVEKGTAVIAQNVELLGKLAQSLKDMITE